jgi:CBS domain-containing protein
MPAGATVAISVTGDAGADRCRALIAANDLGVLPVVDADGRLAGMVTADDLRALGADPVLDRLVLAGDLASGAALALRAGDRLDHALRRMTSQHLGALPVVDGDGRPLAVITRGMLIDHYQQALERLHADRRADGDEPQRSATS